MSREKSLENLSLNGRGGQAVKWVQMKFWERSLEEVPLESIWELKGRVRLIDNSTRQTRIMSEYVLTVSYVRN